MYRYFSPLEISLDTWPAESIFINLGVFRQQKYNL